VTLRTGWTPRILGAVLALAAAWFVVVHADGLIPAVGQVAGLGPAALPVGLAIVAIGVLNRALQAHASFRLVELPARFGAMLHPNATSYATNKVVKSAGTAGLVPYLAHADRTGHCRAQVSAAYLAAKLAETVSLCCLIGLAVVTGAATNGGCSTSTSLAESRSPLPRQADRGMPSSSLRTDQEIRSHLALPLDGDESPILEAVALA